MQNSPRTALFGVTPVSLLLGRASFLADRPPVGLFDPDPQAALRGALFLGLSARKEADHLNPPDEPLEIAIVGHSAALIEVANLTVRSSPYLAICLFENQAGDVPILGRCCWAVPDDSEVAQATAITAEISPLTFTLSGTEEAKKEGRAFLQALSSGFEFR